MTEFFGATITKLQAVRQASTEYIQIIDDLKKQIKGLSVEIKALSNSEIQPEEGQAFGAAMVAMMEKIQVLENELRTKMRALEMTRQMARKSFPFGAKEIVEEFSQLTNEYKENSLSILEENAMEAKRKYEQSIQDLADAYAEQTSVAGEVEQVIKWTMDEPQWVPSFKSLPQDVYINSEHAKKNR